MLYRKVMRDETKLLTDAELIAIILNLGNKNMLNVTTRLLTTNKYENGLVELHNLSFYEIQDIKGIGRIKAIKIKAVLELSKRIAKQKALEKRCLVSTETVVEAYMEEMMYYKQEHFKAVYCDTKLNIIEDKDIAIGISKRALITPREVFSPALKCYATKVLMLHNHPSGDPTPSTEDIELTKRFKIAGNILGISVLDHIVFGNREYVSIMDKLAHKD